VGAGHAGTALALALARAGWSVRAVASRDPDRRATIESMLPGALAVAEPASVAAVADLVLLAVPDDAIADVAARLGARPGSVVAHLSGAHPAQVLRRVVGPEVMVGAFHPLVAFADVGRAAGALRGAFVAIDGDRLAVEALGSMAADLGARPVVLAAGADATIAKAAYHAAAVLAAGGFVALLDAVTELAAVAGLDEATALEVYGSLVHQGLANATASGVAGALTGPVLRGDAGTVGAHLAAIDGAAPGVRELYLATARRQLAIARARAPRRPHDTALERLLEG
jgi:predicted short-subunit dehydrogenase-like oxidoreductase (DUF2520 family)